MTMTPPTMTTMMVTMIAMVMITVAIISATYLQHHGLLDPDAGPSDPDLSGCCILRTPDLAGIENPPNRGGTA